MRSYPLRQCSKYKYLSVSSSLLIDGFGLLVICPVLGPFLVSLHPGVIVLVVCTAVNAYKLLPKPLSSMYLEQLLRLDPLLCLCGGERLGKV